MTEIHDMPDAELVRCVAVEVMPERWTDAYPTWSPLTSWDDAMMVVARMQKLGCPWQIRDDDGFSGDVQMGDEYVDCDPRDHESIRRAVLRAALAAIRSLIR